MAAKAIGALGQQVRKGRPHSKLADIPYIGFNTLEFKRGFTDLDRNL